MELANEIRASMLAVGVEVSDAQQGALLEHARRMLAVNDYLNLTRITEAHDVAILHVADSVLALPALESAPEGPFVDLGSGAGYPGIPLAILSGRQVTLVESRGKKAAFLTEVVAALGLGAEVLPERAEEVASKRLGAFAAVTARALAPLPSLVELAAPLLRHSGILIAMKGDPSAEEIRSGDAAGKLVGMKRIRTDRVELPGTDATRTLVTYRREGAPKVRLPRRPGMAQRKPLA